jgi:lipoprotein NlpD
MRKTQPKTTVAPPPPGIYHKVRKGETLWRIAQAYQVTIERIIEGNNIPDAAKIEINQLILIPGADEARRVAAPQTDVLVENDEFGWPLKGKVVSYFNGRKGGALNQGVDIQASEGAKVAASRSGRVVFADYLNGYGQTVMLDHRDGFYTVYSNNAKVLVTSGSQVRKGDTLALVGRMGSEPYLHFEIRKDHIASNPLYYLP